MLDRTAIKEEFFGILTDDGLALEATLVRPAGMPDRNVQVVQVWLPKYPLTRGSVLTLARRDTIATGERSRMVNLTFDLRGTGESDGIPSPEGFEIDLRSAHEWAKERFGHDVVFRPLGFADLGGANRLVTIPLRPGVLLELYCYNSVGASKGNVLYFSQYTSFNRGDDALCREVADAGYTVYGGDLVRYLLLAGPATPEDLWADGRALALQMDQPLYLVARAFAAGPAMVMAAGVPAITGIIVTGVAQEGLQPAHLFAQDNPAHFMLSRHIKKVGPRPIIFLWNRAEAGQFLSVSLKGIFELAEQPRLWGVVVHVDSSILLNALNWLKDNGASAARAGG